MLNTTAKWLWVIAVLGFVSYHAWPRREALLKALETLGWGPVALALIFILIAKLGLVENMRIACSRLGINLSWRDCFCIYNHTQLAKYVPGAIWQFVGRIAILMNRGFDGSAIRDALVAEHIWVILVAGVLGIGPLLVGEGSYLSLVKVADSLAEQWLIFSAWEGLFVVMTSSIFVAVIFRLNSNVKGLMRWFTCLIPSLRGLGVLLLTWMLFGASLWVTIKPFVDYLPPYAQIVGVYCMAYLIGFLAPFAPAGIGIREGVLVLGLSVCVNAETAILLAAVNRLIYFAAELILGVVGLRLGGLSK